MFLRGFDDDVRAALAEEMQKKGFDLRFDSNIASIEKVSTGLRATLEDGSTLDADTILFATGRTPNTRGLGLEEAGVELAGNGAIVVDEFSRSSVPSIWAVGDATDRINLTPVAIHEAMCLASTLFRDDPIRPVHSDVASAVFSQPPIGSVGLTEVQARETFPEIDIYCSRFRALKHTLTGSQEQILMKLIVDRASDRVVGVHMVGPDAGEIIQGFSVAVKCGATKSQFDATIGIHPTSAEEFVTMREAVSS
jgi:glutathione reductase (NADPH)